MVIVDEKYRINGEGGSWNVETYKGIKQRKDKEEKLVDYEHWEPVTYHSRVESALDSVMNLKLKDLPDMGIKQFLEEAKKIKAELKTCLHIFEGGAG